MRAAGSYLGALADIIATSGAPYATMSEITDGSYTVSAQDANQMADHVMQGGFVKCFEVNCEDAVIGTIEFWGDADGDPVKIRYSIS